MFEGSMVGYIRIFARHQRYCKKLDKLSVTKYNNKNTVTYDVHVYETHGKPQNQPEGSPSKEFDRVRTVPGFITFLMRPFCATHVADSTQIRARPDYKFLGVSGTENEVQHFATLL